jgi:hypothetical protein
MGWAAHVHAGVVKNQVLGMDELAVELEAGACVGNHDLLKRFFSEIRAKTVLGKIRVCTVTTRTRTNSDNRISIHAKLLSSQLQLLRERLFPPESRKTLRTFTSGEAARLIGVSHSYLRQLSNDGIGPIPETNATGRRSYKLAQITSRQRNRKMPVSISRADAPVKACKRSLA